MDGSAAFVKLHFPIVVLDLGCIINIVERGGVELWMQRLKSIKISREPKRDNWHRSIINICGKLENFCL